MLERAVDLRTFLFVLASADDSASNILNLPETPDDYENIIWPEHLITDEVLATDNTPDDNLATNEGALLGRVLFYDQKLSAN
ncbi:MAG: hypothetical protein AAF546_11510 [Verrucomicrobiota bacterium]